MAGTKRFPATKQRIKKAYQQGDIPKSKEITTLAILITGFIWIFCSTLNGSKLQDYYIKMHDQLADFNSEDMLLYASVAIRVLVEILGPFLLLMFLLAGFIEFAQGGFRLNFNAISFKLKRLNMAENLKNIFRASESSPPTKLAYEVLRRGLLLIVFLVVSFSALLIFSLELLHSNLGGLAELNLALSKYATMIICVNLAVFALYAVVDFAISKKRWSDKLRMDTEEFKKELRDTDGNPELKGMRNQLHQEILRNSLVQGVRKARVVVSNQ